MNNLNLSIYKSAKRTFSNIHSEDHRNRKQQYEIIIRFESDRKEKKEAFSVYFSRASSTIQPSIHFKLTHSIHSHLPLDDEGYT